MHVYILYIIIKIGNGHISLDRKQKLKISGSMDYMQSLCKIYVKNELCQSTNGIVCVLSKVVPKTEAGDHVRNRFGTVRGSDFGFRLRPWHGSVSELRPVLVRFGSTDPSRYFCRFRGAATSSFLQFLDLWKGKYV